jgi:hypothetical protein
VESLHETARVNMERYAKTNKKNEDLIAKIKVLEAKNQKNDSDTLTERVEFLHETARVNMERYIKINRKNEDLIAKMKIFES